MRIAQMILGAICWCMGGEVFLGAMGGEQGDRVRLVLFTLRALFIEAPNGRDTSVVSSLTCWCLAFVSPMPLACPDQSLSPPTIHPTQEVRYSHPTRVGHSP